jgi:hypothetical protein
VKFDCLRNHLLDLFYGVADGHAAGKIWDIGPVAGRTLFDDDRVFSSLGLAFNVCLQGYPCRESAPKPSHRLPTSG